MKKKFETEKEEAIDIYNDELMIKLGMRLSTWTPIDFSHTDEEKKKLKKLRTKRIKFYSAEVEANHNIIPVYDKLIIYDDPSVCGNNNTFSLKCYNYQIPHILRVSFPTYKKYYFNGKCYTKVN